ncbi:MAG: bifunctional metallophosphatase/5'-nucleotidase [Clostridia bacterium]|nr:bifunctional metallophosphatase/5'-nucleotidase [Clostridia bacterium]
MKKFLALILAAMLLLGCAAMAEEAAPALTKDVVVLFTSDVHCGIDQGWGYVGLAALRDALVAQGNHVVLADNGDAIQGEPVGTMTKGEALIDLMNTVGYDVAIPGNHEFDYGMDRFLELTGKASFPYISANFNKEGELVFKPYIIKEFDGVKIAFVGITTPKTLTSSTPAYFMDDAGNFIYGFFQDESGEKLYNAVQTAVDAAIAEGADYVVAMGHLGNEAECAPWTYADVIANTTGIDALLDGHSHDKDQVTMKNKAGEDVLRSGCGTKLEGIGYLRIAKDGTMENGLYEWTIDFAASELFKNDVSIAVENATAALNEKLGEVVASTQVDLVIKDPATGVRIVRTAETNLGDLCADAYRDQSGADVAIVNGGGVRDIIKAGEITLNDILKVHPFGNAMCVIEVTGQQIQDALEFGAKDVPSEFGGFLQVSGMTYEIHTYIPSSVKMDEAKMFVGVEGEYRVKNILVGGEPLDVTKTYTLASHNYKLKGNGDGYTMFDGCKILQDEVKLDNQVLMDYITGTLGGVVGEEYADPYGQGRIVAVPEKPAE